MNDIRKGDTSSFINYGYYPIQENISRKKIQPLDSKPGLNFFGEFKRSISSRQREEIKFFARLPTLGWGVDFDY